MKLRQVKDYHVHMENRGANMTFMAFLTDSYERRVRGWIVSGYASEDSHKYFSNRDKACEFMATIFTN